MGCDGGTIPRRNELVKVKQKPEKRDRTSHLIFQWRYCNLTQQLLQRPIVACGLGKLYNKSAIIEAIIDKDPIPTHIKNLKDVIELKLTPNPEFQEGSVDKTQVYPFICPITGLEMSGNFKFVALWSCGCVFSERAIKEIQTNNCPKCQKSFHENEVVVLNPEEDEEAGMTKHIEARKKKRRELKLAMKKKE